MKHRLLLAASSLFLATAVHAGIPVEEDITCPVGGETFTIVSTMSCSSMGATMSLRPITSCDFVTRLPVCPSNGLPLFKDFPADEVARPERYVQTPDYAALRDLAPALRAYHVAKFLGDETGHERLWLLIDAALYDAPAFRSDPANLDLLLAEATATGDKLHADQRAHVFAIIAYQLALAGLDDEARSWMSDAVRVSDDDEFFASYRRALEQCIGQMSSEACAPDTPFSP